MKRVLASRIYATPSRAQEKLADMMIDDRRAM